MEWLACRLGVFCQSRGEFGGAEDLDGGGDSEGGAGEFEGGEAFSEEKEASQGGGQRESHL